jgi:hypothetical protein
MTESIDWAEIEAAADAVAAAGQDDEYLTIKAQMDRIEAKLDQVLAFNATVAEVAAPFLGGKAPKWLALVAKSRGGK